ncbi:MAG TPA: response regulator [Bryobacteraceae bacterium]
MSRILLADDSPHAQRMGERILREEGFEVVTVTDGETALIRMPDVDPDVVLVDILLPHKSGYEICDFVKKSPKHRHSRVVLLAGLLEPVNDAEAARVKADGVLKKPLEASVLIAAVKPLAAAAVADRAESREPASDSRPAPRRTGSILGLSLPPAPPRRESKPAAEELPKIAALAERAPERAAPRPIDRAAVDPELVRAAVTIALDRAMPALIEEITGRVLETLRR